MKFDILIFFFIMGIRKTLDSIQNEYELFNRAIELINVRLGKLSDKLDEKKLPTWKMRIISVRNWFTHILLWVILALLLSSCFVSGRTIHVSTPRVDVSADTATAYSWPYNTKFQ